MGNLFKIIILLVVDSSLPGSLAHIASNAEYYGPSIYLPGKGGRDGGREGEDVMFISFYSN